MSNQIAKQHAEWLSLIDISGPFLSMPVLLRAFPHGLERHDSALIGLLRANYEAWLDAQYGVDDDPVIHHNWIAYVLTDLLDLDDEVYREIPDQAETPYRTAHILHYQSAEIQLILHTYPPNHSLSKRQIGRFDTPQTQMMATLRAHGVPLGLVTNGEQWILVHAIAGETTSFITWHANLWLEEPTTLQAFRALLCAYRFFGVPADQRLTALWADSKNDQDELTDQLGYQVRRATEILVQAIDEADRNEHGRLLANLSERELYEAALTIMMRLVFLLTAEARNLLLLGDPFYNQHYAISTLRQQLDETVQQVSEAVLEYRFDAWSRFLATCRAVYGGVEHQDLHIMPYGGSLFDPDRFPFLEGREVGTSWRDTPSYPLPIHNRTFLHLLDALQRLEMAVPGSNEKVKRVISFRALDVEQIGHVYEGLLDHEAVRAQEMVLGLLGTRNQEPELPLSQLTSFVGSPLLKFLEEQTGRTDNALKKGLEKNDHDARWLGKIRSACGHDDALYRQVLPFVGLIRPDDFGRPTIMPAGTLYVTAGSTRRQTGTHYTPATLTEPIVRHTLEPLVYAGVAEGKPREAWQLRPARQLLALKVCDMAMGSGAFLVQACRYLADRLLEAWDARQRALGVAWPALYLTAEGEQTTPDSAEAIPLDSEERLVFARRLVAERCLYGVDKNSLAVEMAKLSLWLVTLAKNKPFTFLDHALRHGDSLIGVGEAEFTSWANSNQGTTWSLFDEQNRQELATAKATRRELQQIQVLDNLDAERKAALLQMAHAQMARITTAADFLVGLELLDWKEEPQLWQTDAKGKTATGNKAKEIVWGQGLLTFQAGDLFSPVAQRAIEAAQKQAAFHWQFQFPEVFEQGGFSGFIGNPPFIGGQRIRGALGEATFNYVKNRWDHCKGSADYCAYFFLNAYEKLRPNGTMGLIATNTIAQGDTREVGLDHLQKQGCAIYRANRDYPWPGLAAVVVNIIHLYKGQFVGQKWLDDRPVRVISPLLDDVEFLGNPHSLKANEHFSFQGSNVLGLGFTMSPEEAQALIAANPKNADVLFPYLNGQDLNSTATQAPSRWIINFFDWPLERTASGSWKTADDKQKLHWKRSGKVPVDYPDPVASDYPDLLAIVRETVRPQRMAQNREVRKRFWWRYAETAPKLYEAIRPLGRVLVIALTSKTAAFAVMNKDIVFSHATGVFAFDNIAYLALLQSAVHIEWAWNYASSMKGDLRYTPSDVFETFPFPEKMDGLETIGEQYYQLRQQIMLENDEGLTKTYNRFHDPDEDADDIAQLRALHKKMDEAVAAAYGWSDIALEHGFHETDQGIRYTICDTARREILFRLLALNHTRHAEEVAQGLHDKQKPKSRTTAKTPKTEPSAPAQKTLF